MNTADQRKFDYFNFYMGENKKGETIYEPARTVWKKLNKNFS
jgi:hypothetical protein